MPDLPPTFKDWLLVANLLLSGLLSIAVWLRKPGEDAGKAVDVLRREMAEEFAELGHRVTVVEERIKHVPTTSEMAELDGTVRAISMQNSGLAEAIGTMRTQLNRIETYLLTAQGPRT
jgi:predicted  nucleic acid-binding Zn-ribbon protein